MQNNIIIMLLQVMKYVLSYHPFVFILVLIEYPRTPKTSNAPTSTNTEKTATVTAVTISTAAIILDTDTSIANTLSMQDKTVSK